MSWVWLIRDYLVETCGENQSNRRKPPPNPKALATFSHAPVVFVPGHVNGERQLAVSGKALDHMAIRAGPRLQQSYQVS